MSLGIVFKGPEGIVLAADSRVTLTATRQNGSNLIALPATFDNATKLLSVESQKYVAAVTYGLGALGEREPRTAHSFMPEFDAEFAGKQDRLTVEEYSKKLSDFFIQRWTTTGMPDPTTWDKEPMVFVVAGYDDGAAYGRAFEFRIPSQPVPIEKLGGQGTFGLNWGGQRAFVDRLITGFDGGIPDSIQKKLGLDDKSTNELIEHLRANFSIGIPFQFLPLQDCVDLVIFLIRTTINIQTWLVDIRGVGGAIDVATITRTDGFKTVQQKQIKGETTWTVR